MRKILNKTLFRNYLIFHLHSWEKEGGGEPVKQQQGEKKEKDIVLFVLYE